ncbi:MAG: hypothetical protein AAF191_12145 [Verrucomicrobiota bacterium]
MKKSHTQPASPDLLQELCADVREGDGIDPRLRDSSRKHPSISNKPNHHKWQLCKQIQLAIDASLDCDCGDPIFADVGPCEVEPVGGNQRVIVTVPIRNPDLGKVELANRALQQVSGILRDSVAQAIHRKRVPSLVLRAVPDLE